MIETISLTKKYGSLTAVDNVSFKAEPGEVVAFLGPNGAGKSTTMRMITGYIYPTAGTVKIMGRDTEEDPAESRRHIGYLPESAPCYKDIKVREFLRLVAGIRGIAKADIEARVRDALKTAFLEDVENRIIDTLSKGYRQRVCFAQAIIHNPPVLILDEPTDGLDPNQKNEIRHLIKQISKNKTIVLSTHILEEMESVCNRVLIISKGKLVMDTSPDKLTALSPAHNSIRFTYSSDTALDLFDGLQHISSVDDVLIDRNALTADIMTKNGMNISGEVIRYFNEHHFVPKTFTVNKGKIDEVFSSLTLDKPVAENIEASASA